MYSNFVAITPHDTDEVGPFRGIYVGSAGDLVVINGAGTAVTFKSVPVGTIIPVFCRIIKSTGTTASQLVGLAV